VLAHAFDVLHARALFAGHHPDNAASKRTLTALGFRYTHDEPYAATRLSHPSYELLLC
jgi:RimJ/RimL family protein N-acetyltransferase